MEMFYIQTIDFSIKVNLTTPTNDNKYFRSFWQLLKVTALKRYGCPKICPQNRKVMYFSMKLATN